MVACCPHVPRACCVAALPRRPPRPPGLAGGALALLCCTCCAALFVPVWLRRRKRRPQLSLDFGHDDPDRTDLDPPDPDPLPEARAEQSDLRRTLEAALAELPDDWRELVLLVDVHGLAYEEAAVSTGIPIGTVKSRLSRARGRLRDLLRASGELPAAAGRQGG